MIENLQIIWATLMMPLGIAVLGIPAVFRMVSEVAAQSGTYWDYNPELVKALSTARVDTTVGSLLLLAGFLMQMISLCGYEATEIGSHVFIGVCVLFILLYWFWLRWFLATVLANRVKAQIEKMCEAEAPNDVI